MLNSLIAVVAVTVIHVYIFEMTHKELMARVGLISSVFTGRVP
jgi:hypothetical protein